jgi:LysR family transcriptional regulator, regulator for genes of the gallate degradation pathway
MIPECELPNLRHLRVFQGVARRGSISGASREARLTQPAVTQGIAKLEALLDVALFERCQSGCYLTEYGRTYLARADRMFGEMEQALIAPLVGPPFADDRSLKSVLAKITATHVRALIAVTEHRSIETAALKLGISTSSLTRAARDLEGVLKRTLFHSGLQGLTPTKPANELARRFGLAYRELTYAAEEIATLKGINASRVVIGALPLFPVDLIARSVDDLLRAYPGTRVLVVEGAYLSLLDELRAGKIDFLFSILRRPSWAKDVFEETLFRDPYAIVARRGHPLSHGQNITLQDLARFEWVVPELGTPRRTAFERMFADFSRKPRVCIETRSIEFQRGILSASDRISIVTRQETMLEQRMGVLAPLAFVPAVSRNGDGVATRANWKPTMVHLAFLDLLRRNSRDMLVAPQAPPQFSDARPTTPSWPTLPVMESARCLEPALSGAAHQPDLAARRTRN